MINILANFLVIYGDDGLWCNRFTGIPFTGEITGKPCHGRMKDGVKDGEWVYYHDNGQLEEKGSYKNGEKVSD